MLGYPLEENLHLVQDGLFVFDRGDVEPAAKVMKKGRVLEIARSLRI